MRKKTEDWFDPFQSHGWTKVSTLAANGATLTGGSWAAWKWVTDKKEREEARKIQGLMDEHRVDVETTTAEKKIVWIKNRME